MRTDVCPQTVACTCDPAATRPFGHARPSRRARGYSGFVDQAPTASERQALKRLQASLYDWHFCDIKKAASPEVDLPRLAFLGLASWIDTVARLYSGKQGDGFSAWRALIRAYLPERMHDEREIRRLYHGLRNTISHEYGTRDVLLTHANPHLHWQVVDGDLRFLDLHALLDEVEVAFEKFYADLEANADLRARVLPHAQGLLAPTQVQVQAPLLVAPATTVSASATGPAM
jgi:hypothetical protein